MPKYSAGAFITLTIGSTDINLDTDNSSLVPLAYEMPANVTASVALSDVQAYINTNLGFTNGLTIPAFMQDAVNATQVQVDDFLVSTSGDARVEIALAARTR